MPDPITITATVVGRPRNHGAGGTRVAKFIVSPDATSGDHIRKGMTIQVAIWGPAANDAVAVLAVGDQIILRGTLSHTRYMARYGAGEISETEFRADAIGIMPETFRARLRAVRENAIRETQAIHRLKNEGGADADL